MLPCRLLFVCGLLSVALLAPSAAFAESPTAEQIQAVLDSDSDWKVVKLEAKGGVDVYRKDIPGLLVPGFKGIKDVDVAPGLLFDSIMDFNRHVGLSEDIPLRLSKVLEQLPSGVRAFQYLDVPGWTLANDRFWFVEALETRDIGGRSGHHKQVWRNLDPARYPDELARAMAIDDDAVMVAVNHGSWEVVPLESGKVRLIYRVVSDPGGKLPKSVQALATGKTLPDNLLQFEAEARRRGLKGR